MSRTDITELMTILGANVKENVGMNTSYLIVGQNPGAKKVAAALSNGTKIITESNLAQMLAESEPA